MKCSQNGLSRELAESLELNPCQLQLPQLKKRLVSLKLAKKLKERLNHNHKLKPNKDQNKLGAENKLMDRKKKKSQYNLLTKNGEEKKSQLNLLLNQFQLLQIHLFHLHQLKRSHSVLFLQLRRRLLDSVWLKKYKKRKMKRKMMVNKNQRGVTLMSTDLYLYKFNSFLV